MSWSLRPGEHLIVGVVCVTNSLKVKLDCPSGAAITGAHVSVGRYIYQVMLHSVEHAEPVMSSSYFEWLPFEVVKNLCDKSSGSC